VKYQTPFIPKKNFRQKLSDKLKTPTSGIFYSWSLWLLLYALMPFYYTNSISLPTAGLIAACSILFACGDSFASRNKFSKKYANSGLERPETELEDFDFTPQANTIEKIIRYCAIIGIIGAILVVLSKLLLSGLDFASGVSAARFERARESLTGAASNTPIWLYPGMIAFPFGSCAFLLSLLKSESLSKRTRQLCGFAALSPIAVAIINGGRGGIFYFVIMAGGAFLIKNYDRGSVTFSEKFKIPKWIVFSGVAFIFYNIYIFESRREVTAKDNVWLALSDWEFNYGIYPAQWLVDSVQSGIIEGNWLINWMQTHFYFTSGPSILSRIIDSGISIGPFFGQVQIAMLAPLLDRTLPALSMTERIFSETNQIDVTGLIPSGWGMMFLDLGWGGVLVEAFILGWGSRRVYDAAIYGSKLGSKLMFCFVFAGVLLSPIVAPLGFSDNCFTFVSIVIISILMNKIDRASS
jgi:oligosaccharide repeat unit polymerase